MVATPGSVRFKTLLDYLYEVIQDEDLTGQEPAKEVALLLGYFVDDIEAVFAHTAEQPPVRGN